jgi:hypothetical protein
MCHSLASPRSAEYWHIGDTTIRLASLTLRSVCGENSALMTEFPVRKRSRPEYHFAFFPADRARLARDSILRV